MLNLFPPETPPLPSASIRIGSATDFVDLRIEDDIVLVRLSGAVRIAQVREALAAMLESGAMAKPRPALVDLSEFSGPIDWTELRAISQMTDWAPPGSRTMPVAYVSGDSLFAMLIKLAQVFFPRAKHRAFARRDWALDWLYRQVAGSTQTPAA